MTPETAAPKTLAGPLPDIRLITVDMDGTLLDEHHRIPATLWALLPQLRDRGVLFCPASGRQHATLAAQFSSVASDLVVIAENGAFVARGGEEISSVVMERAVVADVVRVVRALAASEVAVGAVVCGKRSAYLETGDPRVRAEAERYYASLAHVDDLLAVDDDVLKVAVFDAGSAAVTTAPALQRFDASHRVVVSGPHWVDVMHPDVHKGAAVQTVQRLYGIARSQTMAFGDYLNDLQMLDAAEHSFAMSNAHPHVLARARYRAPSNSEDGVVRTIRTALALPAATR